MASLCRVADLEDKLVVDVACGYWHTAAVAIPRSTVRRWVCCHPLLQLYKINTPFRCGLLIKVPESLERDIMRFDSPGV